VSWTAAANNGASITGYSVAVLAGSTTVQTIKAAGNATSVSIGGLTNGTAYTVVVTATNIVGSTASKATKAFTPATTPGTPTGVTVARTLKSGAPTAGALTVTWTAPASGGSAITGYSVVCKNGDVVAKTVAVKVVTTAAVTGLTNGTSYVCSVAAINAKGTGTAAECAAIRPGALPGSPASVTGVAGSLKVTLTIGAPTADGGSAVTKYLVTVIDKNKATVGSVIEVLPANIGSVEVSGLSAKSAYTFSVVAQTALGNSVAKVSAKVTTL